MNNRISYFDFLRGIAILMVVAIHTYSISYGNMALAIRQIFNLAVPLFLAISGYFLANKDLSTKDNYLAFLKKQIPKVYIPCLIWSIPSFLLFIKTDFSTLPYGFVLLFVCGFSIYYFIALIIQYYILLPVLQKYVKTAQIGGVMCIVSMICIFLITYFMQIKGYKLSLIVYAGIFPLWIAFFTEGLLIRKRPNRDYKVMPYIFVALLSLVSSYIESKYLLSYNGGGVGIKPSSFVFSFCMIKILFSSQVEKCIFRDNWFSKTIIKIGTVSFGIYLSHIYIVSLVNVFLPMSSIESNIKWLFSFFLVVVFSYFLIMLVRKLFPSQIKFLGFNQ